MYRINIIEWYEPVSFTN